MLLSFNSVVVDITARAPLACFTSPEFAEQTSLPVIPATAAEGLIRSIYWHPGIHFLCREIRICKPIRYSTSKINGVSSGISLSGLKTAVAEGHSDVTLETSQYYCTSLLGVEYQMLYELCIDPDKLSDAPNADPEAWALKVRGILRDRLKEGKSYKQPNLGGTRYPCEVELTNTDFICPAELKGEHDFGMMLRSISFGEDRAPKLTGYRFYRAVARDGVIKVPRREDETYDP